MRTLLNKLAAVVVVSGVVTAFASVAAADHGHRSQGHGYGSHYGSHMGSGYGGGHGGYGRGYGGGYGRGYGGSPSYCPPSRPVWHDTTHHDYHPGQWMPHGNHAHYVPGHYDLHQTGHWDR